MSLLLEVGNLLTLMSKKTTAMKRLVIRITEERTSARKATYQRKRTKVGITTRTTFRYERIDAYGGTTR
ncbi:hypothetical protein CsSME_00046394 [Camellia sinensis var. sinensis]